MKTHITNRLLRAGRLPALALALCSALLFSGCEHPKTEEKYWALRTVPTTDQERKSVSEQVAKIMEATPRSLAGDDQDWDDAIRAATASAQETLCQPTMWEHRGYGIWTGKWHYADEAR